MPKGLAQLPPAVRNISLLIVVSSSFHFGAAAQGKLCEIFSKTLFGVNEAEFEVI